MLCKYDQGFLLNSQLGDKPRVAGKFPNVSLVASVEENRTKASLPVLI